MVEQEDLAFKYVKNAAGNFVAERRLGMCACGALVCPKCRKVDNTAYGAKGWTSRSRRHRNHVCAEDLDEDQQMRIRNAANEEASLALISSVGKRCPVCNMFIEKNEGCVFMTCVTRAHGRLADVLR